VAESTTLIDVMVPPRLDSLSAARSRLGALPEPEEPEGRSDLDLLVTELLTNSVQHAGLGEGELIGLRVSEVPPMLRVEVSDPGRGFRPRVRQPPPGSPNGRGLLLVHRLASRWGVRGEGGACVWFEIPWRAPRRTSRRSPRDHANGVVSGPARSLSRS
jgi:signal transduction histidine kinase